MMADVFKEAATRLNDTYLIPLLTRDIFWAIAALSEGGEVVGGLTAHTLPMTRAESSELFIDDLAVRATHQRQGIGRQLVTAAAEQGIDEVFVAADVAGFHALDFYRALGGAALTARQKCQLREYRRRLLLRTTIVSDS
ncbi:MAG TPA: GNAT family N-acetyltransferase [Gemmatimonadaceae bacterium]|nr:GNAT family N-acetyltransferase [Gemmatimonadaceae bacterium]